MRDRTKQKSFCVFTEAPGFGPAPGPGVIDVVVMHFLGIGALVNLHRTFD